MKTAIDFYFDFISPYGYLAATQVERIASTYARELRWRPFLVGVTVTKIMGMKPLMQTPLKSDYVRIDKPRMASLLRVPLATPDMSHASSVAAARAYYWIEDRNAQTAVDFAKRLLHRLWVDGRDIGAAEAVAEEAASVGIDQGALLEALGTEPVKARLRREMEAAIGRGVFGSPFFIVDGQPIFGVDRLWMLQHWLEHGHWKPA